MNSVESDPAAAADTEHCQTGAPISHKNTHTQIICVHYHFISQVIALETHVVSTMQVQVLQNEQVPADQCSSNGHVTHRLTHNTHSHTAAVQPRQTETYIQRPACNTHTQTQLDLATLTFGDSSSDSEK